MPPPAEGRCDAANLPGETPGEAFRAADGQAMSVYPIAFCRFSSILSKNPVVVSQP